jgi:hypothetical protein
MPIVKKLNWLSNIFQFKRVFLDCANFYLSKNTHTNPRIYEGGLKSSYTGGSETEGAGDCYAKL